MGLHVGFVDKIKKQTHFPLRLHTAMSVSDGRNMDISVNRGRLVFVLVYKQKPNRFPFSFFEHPQWPRSDL